jgi:hypothetical protein
MGDWRDRKVNEMIVVIVVNEVDFSAKTGADSAPLMQSQRSAALPSLSMRGNAFRPSDYAKYLARGGGECSRAQ